MLIFFPNVYSPVFMATVAFIDCMYFGNNTHPRQRISVANISEINILVDVCSTA